jgi:hypothetical protein
MASLNAKTAKIRKMACAWRVPRSGVEAASGLLRTRFLLVGRGQALQESMARREVRTESEGRATVLKCR